MSGGGRSLYGWTIFLVAGALVIGLGSWLVPSKSESGGASTLSRRASGWLLARAYLEARGAEVHLLDRPFEPAAVAGALAVGFPWLGRELSFDPGRYADWVQQGGHLLVGYGGRLSTDGESELLLELGAIFAPHRRKSAGSPGEWRRWRDEVWLLEPGAALGAAARPVLMRALERTALPDDGYVVLYTARDPTGRQRPVVWSQELGAGRVVFLPYEVFANAWFDEPGNADLLATLHAWLGPVWTFDEYHHGLAAPGAPADPASMRVFDLVLLQIALIYLLAVWAAVRRLGRAWREPPVRAGSVAPFLIGLGRLHHRLGHHAEAARLLLARRRELDPTLFRGGAEAEWSRRAAAADERELVALAADVLRQRDRRRRWR